MENTARFKDGECSVLEKQAIQSQNLFRQVVGMKVSTAKTKMLCVSDAFSFILRSYILTSDRTKIASGGREDRKKLLGFQMSNKPGAGAHGDALRRRRFRQRFWVLIHLRSFGFTEEELVRV